MWNNVDPSCKNMTGRNLSMERRFIIIVATILSIISTCTSIISDKRLCYDLNCSVSIATAKTVSKYISNDPYILSFDVNEDVEIFSKSAGSRPDLWGVQIKGKRGYAPSMFLREKKIIHLDLKHTVPTLEYSLQISTINSDKQNDELVDKSNVNDVIVTDVKPLTESSNDVFLHSAVDQVSPSFEVIDGTTFDLLPKEQIQSDHSYATEIVDSNTVIEQPILTVHPNLQSSETILNEITSAETSVLSSEFNDELASQLVTRHVDDNKLPAESLDLVESSQPIINDEVTPHLSESESTTRSIESNVNEEIVKKAPEHNAQNQESSQSEISKPENLEINDSSIDELPKNSIEKIVVESIDEKISAPVLPENTEIIEESSQVAQPEESSPLQVVEDKDEPIISDKISDPIPDTLTKVFDTVTSLFDGLSGTIEKPTLEYKNEESVQESIVDETQFNEDKSANTESNNEEIPVINPSTDNVTQDAPYLDTTEHPVVVSDITFDETNNIATTNIAENISTNVDIGISIQEQLPAIHTDNKLQDSSLKINIEQSSNFNEFPANRNLLNVKDDLLEDSVAVTDEPDTPSAENYDVTLPDEKIIPIDTVTTASLPVISDQYDTDNTNIQNIDNEPVNENVQSIENEPVNANVQSIENESDDKNIQNMENELDETNIQNIEIESNKTNVQIIGNESVNTNIQSMEKEAHKSNIQSIEIEIESEIIRDDEHAEAPLDTCHIDNTCKNDNDDDAELLEEMKYSDETINDDDTIIIHTAENSQQYWETLSYVTLTAITTLLFSLGYYYIENTRRDGQLIAKINKLEKELLISSKECTSLDESLKSTKYKLNSIEDQSFGSNEMVASLKMDLELSSKAKLELEDQVVALEKDLESATEAGLELERMLREILASNNAENPLAKSVEDLQARLNTQQSANETLTTSLHLKTQENEALSNELAATLLKCEQLEVEITRINEELKLANETKHNIEETSSKEIEQLENQMKNISAERITLRNQIRGKEMEIKDLLDVVKEANVSNIDFDKLSDLSHVKAEASQLLEEKEELQMKLNELEGAHHLLEEHMKIINEEMKSLSKQCELAEKNKQDAETRLQVLSKFFKEKEEERQKEEAVWLQQQGEVSTVAERLQTVNNEILSYKQQIETLKREILDQEREYKNQITNLESKSHEQWVLARQSERRLEEAKAEAGQLRNRLTLIEKNYSDNESDVKTHRMDTNGENATSPQLFIGAEASSSPIMFGGPTSMLPPYLYGPPLPPFLPPPLHSSSTMPVGYDVGQRPPPLGGRLSSPPPIPVPQSGPPPPPPALHPSSSGRFEHSSSGPPSPPLSPYSHFRSHPPPPLPFPSDRIHPPPPVPMPSMLSGHLSNTSWGDEKITPRNNGSFHPFHRDQQTRDYKGSLVSSEESLDKTHHSGKV